MEHVDQVSSQSSRRPAGKRRHAAKGSRLVALGLSLAGTGGLSFAMFNGGQTHGSLSALAASGAGRTSASVGSAAPAVPASTAPVTYEGAAEQNRFGVVQVRITVDQGRLTDVQAIQTPGGHQRSVAINAEATPILWSEALNAQSASIDNVSGATYTTESYKASLQSAIDQARAGAATA